MKLKSCFVVAAAVLMLAPAVFAAPKVQGTPVALPDWGTVTIPTDLYLTEGEQPALTAQRSDNDVTQIAAEFYPLTPRTYQVIQKDDAVFQYGIMLHYSTTIYDLQELLGETPDRPSSVRARKTKRPELGDVAQKFSNRFQTNPPAGFQLVQPVTPVKENGKTFYEGVVSHSMSINDTTKTELIRVIAWQHGSCVEIAALFGDSYNKDGILVTLTDMLENAKNMHK